MEKHQEVAEGSKPGIERPGVAEESLEGRPDERPTGEEKGETQLQWESSETPLEVQVKVHSCRQPVGIASST